MNVHEAELILFDRKAAAFRRRLKVLLDAEERQGTDPQVCSVVLAETLGALIVAQADVVGGIAVATAFANLSRGMRAEVSSQQDADRRAT